MINDEAIGYARRVARGFAVDEETLALGVISSVGPGGNYLAEDHTVDHFRTELFLPGPRWTRDSFDAWKSAGGASMVERAHAEVETILASHQVAPLDPALDREIDRIVEAARKELIG